jgi:hypothetical protein
MVCDECKVTARSSFSRLEAAIAHLAEELAIIKLELADMKSLRRPDPPIVTSVPASEAAPTADNDMRTVMVVQRTLIDSARRKRNIVLSGIPETDDDRIAFLNFCEDNLPIKPMIGENSCMRIGKKPTGKPRLLRVRLDSDETASTILRVAPLLRNSTDEYIARNVYINPDLSPAAAKLAYEARKLRRATQRQQSDSVPANSGTASCTGSVNEQQPEFMQPGSGLPTTNLDASMGRLTPATEQADKISESSCTKPVVSERPTSTPGPGATGVKPPSVVMTMDNAAECGSNQLAAPESAVFFTVAQPHTQSAL